MPPDLGSPYAPTWPGNPPHMAATDLPLWRRFQPTLATAARQLYFDVAVGEGLPELRDAAHRVTAAMWRLSRLRIDAVADTGYTWDLIELRPNAGLGAVGHITSYRALWERDPPDTRRARGILVTDSIQPDAHRTAFNAGITVLIV